MKVEIKKAGVAILTPDWTDFKAKATTRDKEGPSNPTPALSPKQPKTPIQEGIPSQTLTAALLPIAKIWKQPKSPSPDEWIKKWPIYSIKYDSAIKKNKTLPFATTWMDPEGITLSQRRTKTT